jgi:hypothetical protein
MSCYSCVNLNKQVSLYSVYPQQEAIKCIANKLWYVVVVVVVVVCSTPTSV